MAGYREKFIRASGFFRIPVPVSLLAKITRQKIIVPVYHLVSDEPAGHIKHLYEVRNEKEFARDLDFLLKNYSPVDYFTFHDIIMNRKTLKKNIFLLTFDDGLREFHDVIAPVLLRKGIPAVCFLNSGFIDNKDLFYRHKASLLINFFSENPRHLTDAKVLNWLHGQPESGNFFFRKIILSVSWQNRQSLDDLEQIIGLDFNQYLLAKQPYLTGAQIISLKNRGFYFGAHSVNHPDYCMLSLDEQIFQTRSSMEEIISRFSLPYRIFSFPFTDDGISEDFFQTIFEKEKIVDLSFGSAGLKRDVFPFHIQRIPFETMRLSAKEIVKGEYFYFLAKAAFGKNRIKKKND